MFQDCPLPPKSEFKKLPKGSYQGYQDQNSGVETVTWNDNGAVTVGFNCEGIQPFSNARRWSTEAKDYINVPRTVMIRYYNSSMEGTDQMDQSIAFYCPFIRNCKWYWPLLLYSVEVSLYNSWLLYRSLEENCSFLDHIRSITMSYLQTYRHTKKIIPSAETVFHNSCLSKRVEKCIRFDGLNHFIGSDEKKSRYALFEETTKHKCTKRDVKLHDYCF